MGADGGLMDRQCRASFVEERASSHEQNLRQHQNVVGCDVLAVEPAYVLQQLGAGDRAQCDGGKLATQKFLESLSDNFLSPMNRL